MAANDNSDDAGGVATTSVFIGANGRGLTNDAARLMAGRQNPFQCGPQHRLFRRAARRP